MYVQYIHTINSKQSMQLMQSVQCNHFNHPSLKLSPLNSQLSTLNSQFPTPNYPHPSQEKSQIVLHASFTQSAFRESNLIRFSHTSSHPLKLT